MEASFWNDCLRDTLRFLCSTIRMRREIVDPGLNNEMKYDSIQTYWKLVSVITVRDLCVSIDWSDYGFNNEIKYES